MPNKCYNGLKRQFKLRHLSLKTKCGLYKALLRLVLICGSEAWTVTKNDEERLWIFERKI